MDFLDWLEQQDYWVSIEDLDEEFSSYELNLEGVTMKQGDEGERLVPRRDLRKVFLAGRIVVED